MLNGGWLANQISVHYRHRLERSVEQAFFFSFYGGWQPAFWCITATIWTGVCGSMSNSYSATRSDYTFFLLINPVIFKKENK